MPGVGYTICVRYQPIPTVMTVQVPTRYLDIFHLLSGPTRPHDLEHWFKLLGGSDGFTVRITSIDDHSKCPRYGPIGPWTPGFP